ncbi:MAG: hypothetical protein WA210_05405 [Burkholderiaceae bacterium]
MTRITRITRIFRAAGAACLALALPLNAARAHDAINGAQRLAYIGKLDAAHRTANSNAPTAVRAAALFQIGSTLDELRELLNEDIISHGKTQGLETSLLVAQLDAMPTRLVLSPRSGTYAANLKPYRDALALDAQAGFANRARQQILKGQFYDSFSDDPLKPHAQSRDQLLEMIATGEALLRERDRALDVQEIVFILAIHYLQAHTSGDLPKAQARERFAQLLHEFRLEYPNSLKLATLEALAPAK